MNDNPLIILFYHLLLGSILFTPLSTLSGQPSYAQVLEKEKYKMRGAEQEMIDSWLAKLYADDNLLNLAKADSNNVYILLDATLSEDYFKLVDAAHHEDVMLHNLLAYETDEDQLFYNIAKIQYFRIIKKRYKTDLDKILYRYPVDYYTWFPFAFHKDHEFAILFHHIASHLPETGIELPDYVCRFIEEIYRDYICEMEEKEPYHSNNSEKKEVRSRYLSGRFLSAKSSANLSDKYSERHLIDSDLDVCWAVGENGIGHWFEIALEKEEDISEIVLFNGYAKSEKLFKANARIKSAQLTIDDSIHIELEFKDQFYPTVVEVDKLMTKVRFVINAAYPGSKYEDLCVSEIAFIRRD
jgi:hypothetical protein